MPRDAPVITIVFRKREVVWVGKGKGTVNWGYFEEIEGGRRVSIRLEEEIASVFGRIFLKRASFAYYLVV